jgi:hypothetical protein
MCQGPFNVYTGITPDQCNERDLLVRKALLAQARDDAEKAAREKV